MDFLRKSTFLGRLTALTQATHPEILELEEHEKFKDKYVTGLLTVSTWVRTLCCTCNVVIVSLLTISIPTKLTSTRSRLLYLFFILSSNRMRWKIPAYTTLRCNIFATDQHKKINAEDRHLFNISKLNLQPGFLKNISFKGF